MAAKLLADDEEDPPPGRRKQNETRPCGCGRRNGYLSPPLPRTVGYQLAIAMLSTTRQAGKASSAMTLPRPLSTSTVTTLPERVTFTGRYDAFAYTIGE
jgi:hypothetical protein